MRLLDLSHRGLRFGGYIETSGEHSVRVAVLYSADTIVLLEYDSWGIARVVERFCELKRILRELISEEPHLTMIAPPVPVLKPGKRRMLRSTSVVFPRQLRCSNAYSHMRKSFSTHFVLSWC